MTQVSVHHNTRATPRQAPPKNPGAGPVHEPPFNKLTPPRKGRGPSEAVLLPLADLHLPDSDGKWGWLHRGASAPPTGGPWTDPGARRERRQLKHRAAQEVRPVPVSPALARLLRKHIAEYGTAPDGRLFRGEAGGLLSDTVYGRTWEKARQAALTPAEAASPLAERPYDLRHARLSTWLNTGVAPAQVAEWAGNSVPVLLRDPAAGLCEDASARLREHPLFSGYSILRGRVWRLSGSGPRWP